MIDYRKLLIDEIYKNAKERISKGKDYHYNKDDIVLFIQYFEDTGNIQFNIRVAYDFNTRITMDVKDIEKFLNEYL